MELSEATLAHLRDEAYALLVQQALVTRLAELETERAAIATTRPRFGVLARRESRETFERSMREVDDNEAALRAKHAKITTIYEWLHPVIRKDVSSYLAGASPDYCRLLQIAARLTDWERAYRAMPELLVAFARDLRGVQLALASKKQTADSIPHAFAVLRQSAERISRQQFELAIIEQAALALAPAGLADQIHFPALPNLQRLPWVSELAVSPREQAHAEVMRVETELRTFLAGPGEQVLVQLQETRDTCANLVQQTLESYWNQLREHACAHYVEAREIDDVIAMLTERYIGADIRSRQRALGGDQYHAH